MQEQPPAEPVPPSQPIYQPHLSQPLPPSPPSWQPPYQPPPAPPAPSKSTTPLGFVIIIILLVAALVAVVALSYQAGRNSVVSAPPTPITTQQPTPTATAVPPTPTATPAPTPSWTTVQSFSGSTNKKTAIFSVPNDWKLLWTCTPDGFGGGTFAVLIYSADNSPIDLAVNTICKAGMTSDETEEHQSGSIYLDVTAHAPWTIQIQVLQ